MNSQANVEIERLARGKALAWTAADTKLLILLGLITFVVYAQVLSFEFV